MKKHGLLKLLTSMRLATVLIAIIVVACILGSVIPQKLTYNAYREMFGSFSADVISTFAIDHVFTSAWFFTVLSIFFINLACCTASRFFWAANTTKNNKKNIVFWGSPIFHVGLCIVYIGVLLSAISGKKSYYEISVGDEISLSEFNTSMSMRIDKFDMEYYDDGSTPKQYISHISLSRDDGFTKNLTTSVNSPARYNGVSFLQQSYGWEVSVSLFTNVAQREYKVREEQWIPLSDDDEGGIALGVAFYPDYKQNNNGEIISSSGKDSNPRVLWVLRANNEPAAMGTLSKGESNIIMEQLGIRFDDYRNYTGIQVKYDRGIAVIFIGFLVSCIGILLRYLPINAKDKKKNK